MSVSASHHNPIFVLGVSPKLFADKKGKNTGLHAEAVNITVHDYYTRKSFYGPIVPSVCRPPGGFGL